ncbi:hypothetical protein VPNG_06882 [Cytospora leucostoma]|uniref:Major facilitator superfamily (MFS) profile domain-containing protein n=1 Tax=Cytospora leucostoma TaxID=1230097 RepID=A0A423WXC9_9PEZI|nr:hypothetical protein VPNG_06882 [Cytospora leucostoma]
MADMTDEPAGDLTVGRPRNTEHNNGYNHDLEAGRTEHDHHSTTVSVTDNGDGSSSQHSNNSSRGVQADQRPPVTRISTNVSVGHDTPLEHYTSYVEVPDAVYDRTPRHRKVVIVALLSYCAFLAPISSTTVLSATPEVAAEYHTTGSIVDLSNALYMLFMGISPLIWGPFSEVWGRRTISCTTALLFFCCSIGTALSPNLAAFFIFRILTAFEGTAFLLVGSACLQDIYRPTERATAMGWFLSGTLIGPAIGPFVGGIIVTYTSWRVIFWVQTGLSGLAALGTFFLLPETIHHKNIFVGIASSSLVWNMYSLLTPIRYVLNPRFNLTTPMQSGLFYLAPGAGYLLGTFFGGRYADHIVKKYIAKSPDTTPVPEDRMRSALPFMGVVIPACVLIYGWSVDRGVGGIPLAVVMLFLQGVAQLFCLPSLNTYCLDVMQRNGSDVIAGNYFLRYLFACLGTAVVLPAVERIGVGWFSTISALFLVCSTLGTWATIIWGKGWRERVDRRRGARKLLKMEREKEREREVTTGRRVGGIPSPETTDHDENNVDENVDAEKMTGDGPEVSELA